MNILFATTFYYPYVSGLTIHVQRIAENLIEKKFHVQVVASQHDKNLPLEDNINSVKVKRVPYLFKISKGVFMPFYIFHIIPLIAKADRIVVSLPQFDSIWVAILAKIFGKKLTCLYVCQLKFERYIFERMIGIIMTFVEYVTLFLSDKIITLTWDYAKNCEALKPFSKKIECIYPLIYKPSSNQSVKNKLGASRFKIGGIGRFSREKGFEYLIKAIPFIREKLGDSFSIILAGPGDTIGEERYKKRIMRLVGENKKIIKFIGFLKPQELGSFYSLLDVFVIPSISPPEVFGLVQVEAMLSGTPVVASNIPGVRVPVKRTMMGELCNPKDPRDIADKVLKVISNKEKYIRKKSKAEKEFNAKTVSGAYKQAILN